MRASVAMIVATLLHSTWATAAEGRYSLSGEGALRFAAPAQSGSGLRLEATLLPKDAVLAASPPVQENARFALMAAITASSLVCYSDTIFRNDFDGDGF